MHVAVPLLLGQEAFIKDIILLLSYQFLETLGEISYPMHTTLYIQIYFFLEFHAHLYLNMVVL